MSAKAKDKVMKVRNRDEDDDSLSSPCFQIDPNVELKDIPTTGDEYLLKVMKERQTCLVVTKCNKDLSKFAKNQSCFVKERAVNSAPISLKPTIEWQNIQVADFSDVRMYVSRLQTKKNTWPHAVKKIEIDCNDLATWKNFFENNSPTLTCVFGLDQALLDNGLEFLIGTLNKVKAGDTLCQMTGRWIYAFLACIQLPLLSDTISILRDLARKCAEIRSHINEANENAITAVAPLNIFICLVSRYFRQHDLAD